MFGPKDCGGSGDADSKGKMFEFEGTQVRGTHNGDMITLMFAGEE